jgi:ATP-dependent helicase/nuclease subunit B
LPSRRVAPAPVPRPAPGARDALPASLSASAVQALRDCPYRFFARVVLRLGELQELESELDRRDVGTWLHAVLHRFHATRAAPADADAEVAHLLALADTLADESALPAAELLPFRVMLEQLAPRYVQWLHARDVEGWAFDAGEAERRAAPDALGACGLHGRIDRIDRGAGALQLIDYKTGSKSDLKEKVKSPLEDTQLAFYAALMGAHGDAPLQALYLVLDGDGPHEIEHPDVEASARALVAGLAHDLARLRAGAGLAALGEGRVCEYCEARGLCRRDHWT